MLNLALWIGQALLALAIALSGALKAVAPMEGLARRMEWVTSVSPGLVRFIGIAEVLGGIGLLLPGLAHFMPGLTLWAAAGIAVVMVLAAIFHTSRREYAGIAPTAVLFAFALFIVIGRIHLPA